MLLLAWAAVDISVPGVCRTDGLLVDTQGSTTSVVTGTHRGTLPQQADADDCFCCCSHIVYSRSWKLADTSIVGFTDFYYRPFLLPSYSSPLFRPPRA
jgi:hypothetical protein